MAVAAWVAVYFRISSAFPLSLPIVTPKSRRQSQALGPQAVEVHRVTAAGLDVLEALAAAQRVVGDVEHVI
jgi:hypothetical protein